MEIGEEETPDVRPKDTRKRRSSIFQRKSILFTDVNSVAEDLEETKTDKSSASAEQNVQKVEEAFDLQKYVDKLKAEIAAWHDVVKERQAEYKKLVRKKSELKANGQEVDLSLLSKEDREFIEARPNLDLLMSSTKELLEVTVKTVTLNHHLTERYDSLQSLFQQKLDEAKEKIISMID